MSQAGEEVMNGASERYDKAYKEVMKICNCYTISASANFIYRPESISKYIVPVHIINGSWIENLRQNKKTNWVKRMFAKEIVTKEQFSQYKKEINERIDYSRNLEHKLDTRIRDLEIKISGLQRKNSILDSLVDKKKFIISHQDGEETNADLLSQGYVLKSSFGDGEQVYVKEIKGENV